MKGSVFVTRPALADYIADEAERAALAGELFDHVESGRISIEIPFNIPPDRPTHVMVASGGDPPVNPAVERLTFEAADPYAVETEQFTAAVLDGRPVPVPPADAVANLEVIERLRALVTALQIDLMAEREPLVG